MALRSAALLLDLDRTLVDLQSYTDYAAALSDVAGIVGEWPEADVPDTDWDRPTQACMSVLHSLLGDDRWHQVSRAIAQHERAAIPSAVVMPTVMDALPLLVSVPSAVVTLLPGDVATDVLRTCGIDVGPRLAVDLVIGRDRDVRPKPSPDGLLTACAHLGVDPRRSVMIGDASWDEEAAQQAGTRFIGVPSSGAGAATRFGDGVPCESTFLDAVRRALGP